MPIAVIPPTPDLPGDAPQWAHDYAIEVQLYVQALLSRINTLEARLAAAGIP